ncbi:unnamed protein product, partial [Brassica rapa]
VLFQHCFKLLFWLERTRLRNPKNFLDSVLKTAESLSRITDIHHFIATVPPLSPSKSELGIMMVLQLFLPQQLTGGQIR